MPMELYAININLNGKGSGSLHLHDLSNGTALLPALDPEDVYRFKVLAWQIFEEKQAGLAKGILDIKQPALPAPSIEDADFTEIPF